jgi:hypothetical protein
MNVSVQELGHEMQEQPEEQLDEVALVGIREQDKEASPPWIQQEYVFKPLHETRETAIFTTQAGKITVGVPKFRQSIQGILSRISQAVQSVV